MDDERFRQALISIHQNQILRHQTKNYAEFTRTDEKIGEESAYLVYLFIEKYVPDELKEKVEFFSRQMGSIGNLLDNVFDTKEDRQFFGLNLGIKSRLLDLELMLKHGLKMASKINWYVVSEFLIASLTGVYKEKHF